MDTVRKPKPSMREYLHKKAPFYFLNLFTALLVGYLFLPTLVNLNYYQMAGRNQIISVSIDMTETSTYLSRLVVYKEISVDDIQTDQRVVFYDEIAGTITPCDGRVFEDSSENDYFVIMSEQGLVNQISDENFVGTFLRESNALDRFMYFNFEFHWRILTDINLAITAYVFYFVFFKKEQKLVPVEEKKVEPKKNKAPVNRY